MEIKRERQGLNELALFRLDKPRRTWSKGPLCHYELVYYWHRDERENSVLGSDIILATKKEAAPVLKGASLFDCFEMIS